MFGSVSGRFVRSVARCGRRVGRRPRGATTGSGSGRRSPGGCRARTPPRRSACPKRSGHVGSVRLAGCRRSPWPRFRAAICRSPSGRRSRSCTHSKSGYARSPAVSAGRRRRSRGSCAATHRLARIAWTYRASTAQWHAERRASRPKVAKLAANDRLREYVQDRLAGTIVRPDGELVPGPEVRFIGRRHGRRADRRWARSWSPEQISNRLGVEFPDDESMRISHEAIYQALYVQGRGALRRELVACLRTGRALRVPRARTRGRGKTFVTPEILISERPAEAEDRAVPGHWEGDLIVGLDSSAIGTLVERTTRFALLLHLPRMDGHGNEPRTKNGPALAGHGAEAVRDAIAEVITTLPAQLRRSLTWDQGAEMAQHAQLGHRHWARHLLLRPAQPMAAGHQREHQRPAAPVLPQGHRPRPPLP